MAKAQKSFMIACCTSYEAADRVINSGGKEGDTWNMCSEALIWSGPAENRPDLTRLKFSDSGNVYALMSPAQFDNMLRAHGWAVIGAEESLMWRNSAQKKPPRPSGAKVFKPL